MGGVFEFPLLSTQVGLFSDLMIWTHVPDLPCNQSVLGGMEHQNKKNCLKHKDWEKRVVSCGWSTAKERIVRDCSGGEGR